MTDHSTNAAQPPLIQTIEAEARRFAGMYPQSSDGRNTFVIFADWVARLAAQPPAAPVAPSSAASGAPQSVREALLDIIDYLCEPAKVSTPIDIARKTAERALAMFDEPQAAPEPLNEDPSGQRREPMSPHPLDDEPPFEAENGGKQ
jgi:hypothetical protein